MTRTKNNCSMSSCWISDKARKKMDWSPKSDGKSVYQVVKFIELHAKQGRKKMRYYSKKNIWLMAILWFVLLLPLALGILFLSKVGPGGIWGIIFLAIMVDVPL